MLYCLWGLLSRGAGSPANVTVSDTDPDAVCNNVFEQTLAGILENDCQLTNRPQQIKDVKQDVHVYSFAQ